MASSPVIGNLTISLPSIFIDMRSTARILLFSAAAPWPHVVEEAARG
jgi:hypothetical protein